MTHMRTFSEALMRHMAGLKPCNARQHTQAAVRVLLPRLASIRVKHDAASALVALVREVCRDWPATAGGSGSVGVL